MTERSKNTALKFVLMLGIVSLFADFTYEGARSIAGPFLGILGASASVVGCVAGFGELIGYVLRSVTGYLAQRTQKYWAFAFSGYLINMLAVPALTLAGSWPVAAALMVTERTGRAIRKPVVDTMISYTEQAMGRGFVFGLHEAMDQTGATLGPLVVALILTLRNGDYHYAFAFLLIPALICIGALTVARMLHPAPHQLYVEPPQHRPAGAFSTAYWLYVCAGALFAAGFADFALVAFHFQKTAVVGQNIIPIFYAVAMACSGAFSLIFGRALDRVGSSVTVLVCLASAFYSPLVFSNSAVLALAGSVLWGLGMALQESMLKAELTAIVPVAQRSGAYGVFDAIFGVGWFIGSAAMGFIYDRSIFAVIVVAVTLQLAALPLLVLAKKFSALPPPPRLMS